MRRGLGFNGRFGGRRVGLLGTLALVAALAAGPGMLTARSSTPVGTIERVSVPGPGGDRNARNDSGSSVACSPLTPRRCAKRTLSDDGTKVVYSSAADNLVDGDTNGHTDIFLTTLTPGTPPTPPNPGAGGAPANPGVSPAVVSTVRISVGPGGVEGNGDSPGPAITGDGTKVAFTSNSTNLGTSHAKGDDVFVRKLGATYSMYMLTSGATSYLPNITAAGDKVIFIADGIDTDGVADIYQGPSDGSARPTIFANCPCRSGGDVPPGFAVLGTGGAIAYSSAAPFSKSNRYLDPQLFEHNPGQAILSAIGGEPATAAAELPSVTADR